MRSIYPYTFQNQNNGTVSSHSEYLREIQLAQVVTDVSYGH
jgi:hypothetical protein